MVHFSKNPRYHIHENTRQYQEQVKIYEEGHHNESYPPSLYDIILNIINYIYNFNYYFLKKMSEFAFKLIISFLFLLLFLFYYINLKFSKNSNEKRILKIIKIYYVNEYKTRIEPYKN